jgi:hypothetical protein
MRRTVTAILTVGLVTAALVPVDIDPAAAGDVEWPDQIAPIAEAVEEIRGLEFERAVPVHFLSDAEFEERFAPTARDLGFADESMLHQQMLAYSLLGLVPADFDALAMIRQQADSGLAGIATRRGVWIKGTEITPGVEFVLAHELTHALQFQHFGIGARGPGDELQQNAIDMLSEGEANWVGREYVDRMPFTRRQLALEVVTQPSWIEASVDAGIPEVLGLTALAPYDVGEDFVRAFVARNGRRALDRLWRKPPRDDAAFVDPLRDPNARRPLYEFDDAQPPATSEPWRMGASGFYYLVTTRLIASTTLEAATHWDGNTTELYRDGERDCVRSAFWADSPEGFELMKLQLGDWAYELNGEFTYDETIAQISRCSDAGSRFGMPYPWARRHARMVQELRTNLIIIGLEEGLSEREVRCVVDAFLDDSFELMLELAPPEPDDPVVSPAERGRQLSIKRGDAAEKCDVDGAAFAPSRLVPSV